MYLVSATPTKLFIEFLWNCMSWVYKVHVCTCPPPFRESISWIISPFKFWTATIFLHAFNCNFLVAPLWRMGPRCRSAETHVCHRSYIVAASLSMYLVSANILYFHEQEAGGMSLERATKRKGYVLLLINEGVRSSVSEHKKSRRLLHYV
jgi:hypothetical protein